MLPLDIMKQSITVHRKVVGTYDANDRWVEGADEVPLTYTGVSVQPATGDDLKLLPEAERSDDMILIFCVDELRVTDKTTGTEADIVGFGGAMYKVIQSQHWDVGFLNHYEALADRVRQ